MSSEKLSAMIPKGKPFEFEGLDVRPGFRANDGGAHTYTANFMITEEMWNAIKTIPRHRMIKGILLWYDDDAEMVPAAPKSEPTEPASQDDAFEFGVQQEPTCGCQDCPEQYGGICPERPVERQPPTKGPWGDFYRECFARGLQNVPELIAELKVNGMGQSVKLALRARFKEDSLTKVRPDRLQAWLAQKKLASALVITEQALEKLGGAQYKWGKKEEAA